MDTIISQIIASNCNLKHVKPITEQFLKANKDVLQHAYSSNYKDIIYGVWTQEATDSLPYQQYLIAVDTITLTVIS